LRRRQVACSGLHTVFKFVTKTVDLRLPSRHWDTAVWQYKVLTCPASANELLYLTLRPVGRAGTGGPSTDSSVPYPCRHGANSRPSRRGKNPSVVEVRPAPHVAFESLASSTFQPNIPPHRDQVLLCSYTHSSLSQPHFNILLNSYLVILKSVINRGGPIRVKACYIIYTATWMLFDVLCLQTQY
jgi:hypothetical protein